MFETNSNPQPFALLNDPSCAASALQKCIRRGDLGTAERAAEVLLSNTPEKFWRRLIVIALEDIGLGDLEVVRDVLDVSGRKAWRRDNGGDQAIAMKLISRLCSAPKVRAACDLLVVADLHPDLSEDRKRLFSFSDSQLVELVTDETERLEKRMIAAWYLAGTSRYPALNLHPREGRYDKLLEAISIWDHSNLLVEVGKLGSTRTREAHSVALPLLASAIGGDVEFKSAPVSTIAKPVVIGGWPSFVFDMHTMYGRKAISTWLKMSPRISQMFSQEVSFQEKLQALNAAVFRVEGAVTDRTIISSQFDKIRMDADFAQTSWGHFSRSEVQAFLNRVRSELPMLDRLRAETVQQEGIKSRGLQR